MVAIVLLIAGSLASCARGPGSYSGDIQRVNGVVLMSARLDFRLDAVVQGTLTLNAEGCLGLVDEAASPDVIPALWPAGSRIVDAGSAVEIGSQTYAIGDWFVGGGGELAELPINPDPACEASNYIVVTHVD